MNGIAFLFMLLAFAVVVVWYVQNVEHAGGGEDGVLGLDLREQDERSPPDDDEALDPLSPRERVRRRARGLDA